MALYYRIIGEEEPKLPVHEFMALIAEWSRGVVTREEISICLGLDTGEAQSLDDILDKSDSLAADRRFEFGRMMHDIMLLTESGLKYTNSVDFFTRVDEFV